VADRYPLWNVELANTEQLVDNRLVTSVYVITGVDESKTRVMTQSKRHSGRALSTPTANVDSVRSVVGHTTGLRSIEELEAREHPWGGRPCGGLEQRHPTTENRDLPSGAPLSQKASSARTHQASPDGRPHRNRPGRRRPGRHDQ